MSQLGNDWQLTSRLDIMYTGETFFSPVQSGRIPNFFTAFGFGDGEFSRQKRDSSSIGNLNFVATNGDWTINLWSKNFTDEDYLEEVIPAPEFGGSFIHDSYGEAQDKYFP